VRIDATDWIQEASPPCARSGSIGPTPGSLRESPPRMDSPGDAGPKNPVGAVTAGSGLVAGAPGVGWGDGAGVGLGDGAGVGVGAGEGVGVGVGSGVGVGVGSGVGEGVGDGDGFFLIAELA
jgi:hypothetical protein